MAISIEHPRNSPEMKRFWYALKAHKPTVKLGGAYTDKRGYHNFRANLPATDYSVEDVKYDRQGPDNYASAIDLTFPDAADMRLYTKRLVDAARRKDPRLYIDGIPVLREIIGTLDSESVYCWVLIGGVPLGVGADSGSDPGRDKSHLYHIHLSFIRKFCDVWRSYSGVLAVMRGDQLEEWEYPLLTQGDLAAIRNIVADYVGDVVPRWSDTGGHVPPTDTNPTMTAASGIFYAGATAKRIENGIAAILDKLDSPA